MSKRPFVPSFLQHFDDTLLRNKPTTWSARTHLVLWFALLFAIALAGCCYLAFYDPREDYSIEGWITFVALVAFVGFVFWVIFLLRFNVFKRYGNWLPWDGLKTFILYLISIGSMVAVCFIPSAIQTLRANQKYKIQELVADVNEMNTSIYQLEYDILPKQWKRDSCWVRQSGQLATYSVQGDEIRDSFLAAELKNTHYSFRYMIDSSLLKEMILNRDSVTKINDSLHVFYDCPKYVFVNTEYGSNYDINGFLSSNDIYRTVRPSIYVNKIKLEKRMKELNKKYALDSQFNVYEALHYPYSHIVKTYNISPVDKNISLIIYKMNIWNIFWPIYLRVFYYATIILTLLMFVFRHSTLKTFLLSLLSILVLSIFSGLFITLSSGKDLTVSIMMIVYYLVFLLIGLATFSARTRKLTNGISLNLFVLMTPFVPSIVLGMVSAIDAYQQPYELYHRTKHMDFSVYLPFMEIGGLILFLALLEPVFRKLYRKWYAAAEV